MGGQTAGVKGAGGYKGVVAFISDFEKVEMDSSTMTVLFVSLRMSWPTWRHI